MTNLETMLVGFNRAEAANPTRWGHDDCSMRIANWWRFVHGVDPAAFLRGTYHSRVGAKMACLRAGGLARLVADIAERVGAEPVPAMSECVPIGAFGVLVLAGVPRGYIAARDRLSIRADDGLAFILPEHAERIVNCWGVV
jgi:hypothetical protein